MTAETELLPFDPSEVAIQPYEEMTREELIECCHTHDAHHAEHHEWIREIVRLLYPNGVKNPHQAEMPGILETIRSLKPAPDTDALKVEKIEGLKEAIEEQRKDDWNISDESLRILAEAARRYAALCGAPEQNPEAPHHCSCLFIDDKVTDICCYHEDLEAHNYSFKRKNDELRALVAVQHNELLALKKHLPKDQGEINIEGRSEMIIQTTGASNADVVNGYEPPKPVDPENWINPYAERP